jgi:hypothetical protein
LGFKRYVNEDWTLVEAQHRAYGSLHYRPFIEARRVYRAAGEILGVKTDLGALAEEVKTLDYRVFRDVYELIAAHYRSSIGSSRQLRLPFDGEDRVCRPEYPCWRCAMKIEWSRYFERQVEKLASSPNTCRAILRLGVFQSNAAYLEISYELIDELRHVYDFFE